MRYVHTAAVTSHAALTCSPRESASHANAPAPTIATRSHPTHESNLPMRVPSLGVLLSPNWPAARAESTATRREFIGGCRALSGIVTFALPFHSRDPLSLSHLRARRRAAAPRELLGREALAVSRERSARSTIFVRSGSSDRGPARGAGVARERSAHRAAGPSASVFRARVDRQGRRSARVPLDC